MCAIDEKFQLTLPVWGATTHSLKKHTMILFQLTLPVWGATIDADTTPKYVKFQLTLPVWGATIILILIGLLMAIFQLTLPVWGATMRTFVVINFRDISTHAPRVGSDLLAHAPALMAIYFNSRSPCGERPGSAQASQGSRANFNSRSPCGERRELDAIYLKQLAFQLTLPVWGATTNDEILQLLRKFQLTLPVWGATPLGADFFRAASISTHAPRVGSDLEIIQRHPMPPISTHAPRVGSDRS